MGVSPFHRNVCNQSSFQDCLWNKYSIWIAERWQYLRILNSAPQSQKDDKIFLIYPPPPKKKIRRECILWARQKKKKTQRRLNNQTFASLAYLFVCLKPHEQFFTYLVAVTVAGDRAANLGLCSALRAFEQGGIFIMPHLLRQPRFIRSHLKDRHPRPTVKFEPPTHGSLDLCARRSNHCATRATSSLAWNRPMGSNKITTF
jgi:hypothetical protein